MPSVLTVWNSGWIVVDCGPDNGGRLVADDPPMPFLRPAPRRDPLPQTCIIFSKSKTSKRRPHPFILKNKIASEKSKKIRD